MWILEEKSTQGCGFGRYHFRKSRRDQKAAVWFPELPEGACVLRNMRRLFYLGLFALLPLSGFAQTKFDVATIRPSTERVEFERDGQTTLSRRMLRMHDVTVRTCLAFAYNVSTAQVAGPASLTGQRYDITAQADHEITEMQMRQMLQSLLADRFHLTLHHEQKKMRGYVMTAFVIPPKDPARFHRSTAAGEPYRESSASGTVARNITMKQFADFLSGPLEGPVADETNLPGAYDLDLDFTPYVNLTGNPSDLPSSAFVLNAALKGELGLQIASRTAAFDVLVVDSVEEPTAN